jgi:sugar (pentulose or hexulose) kinase
MLALGVTREGRAALITGSSNVLLALSEATVRARGIWGGYPDGAVAGYDLVVGLHSAGSVTRWLTRDVLGDTLDLDDLGAEAARISPGSNGLVLLPDFQGNRTPFTEPRARGAIWGLSLAHGPAHLYRAALEGIACASRQALDAMGAAGVRVDEVRACGGATRSDLVMQITADLLGRPITTNATADASALGAAMSAAIGIGLYPDFDASSRAMGGAGETYHPDPANGVAYDLLYDRFRRTYPALLPLMREQAGDSSDQ